MLTRSATYNSIFAGQHSVEWKITVNGTDYGVDKISSSVGGGDSLPKLSRSMFTGSDPAVGGCCAATFECTIFEASANVPRMATVVPAYRIKNSTQTSEWITLGTFYIDTRSVNKSTGALSLYCYDRMLVASADYAEVTGFDEWPQSMSAVVNEIASIIGVTVDSRTSINSGTGYQVDYPNDLTMREVLGYIASAHAGNWCITPGNKLRLIPITGGSDSYTLGSAAASLKASIPFSAWTGVEVYTEDDTAYEAGDDTGRVLTCDCPWATQETANGILAAISGHTYQPYTVSGAFPDLALELGDKITVGMTGDTITGPVFTIDITADVLEAAGLAAPGEAEIDHEYPYVDAVDRSLRRKVTLGKSYYGTEISREKGLYIARTDGKSNVTLNSDQMVFRGLVDGVMQDQIYFDPVSGRYIFNGALGADAIFTQSLYAESGDVAELTVDRLSTSQRIRKYILSDTSDDNFVDIHGQYIRYVTGSYDSTANPDHVQAQNRYGQNLYWQREPVSHTADGYPLDADGDQIYATTDVTDYPVYVYVYIDLVKAKWYFAAEGGTYVPMIVLGAGDEHGYTKGTLHKSAQGFDIAFVDSDGEETGIQMNTAGYMDLFGLRRPTALNFSGWANGSFTETIDGSATYTFLVDFDANGLPVKITDGDGHETAVTW